MNMVKAGDRVRVVDAFGDWHDATAASGVEGVRDSMGHKVHTFPVVWVRIDGFTDRVPWPQESVEPSSAE